jgi:hypothetical protein
MDSVEAHDDIARLEERIAELNERIARCRKLSAGAKAAIAAGAAWLVLTLLAIVAFTPAVFFGAIAAVIGGVVLLGSNKTSWEQFDAAVRTAEAQRASLIDALELRIVDEGVRRLH